MVAAAGGRWAALYNDAKEYFADGGIQLDKYLILKVSSVVAGALMILAGMIGSSALFLGGGFAYFIGSLYAIAFGVLVQVIEIKNKYGDPPERIKPLGAKGCFTWALDSSAFTLLPRPESHHGLEAGAR
ncbi:hypothetical protein AB1Y20_022597 [Prymnesium parvum]|uniref:H(+)-exporting diphosphatase n=1 Tax=Prymnesium parvum TaxID=97485 RepID=A0AB34JJH0_PRYPA